MDKQYRMAIGNRRTPCRQFVFMTPFTTPQTCADAMLNLPTRYLFSLFLWRFFCRPYFPQQRDSFPSEDLQWYAHTQIYLYFIWPGATFLKGIRRPLFWGKNCVCHAREILNPSLLSSQAFHVAAFSIF